MIYLREFTLPDENIEHAIVCYGDTRRIFNNYYPLHLFCNKQFQDIKFGDITIFYGDNGSGKTTLINIISEKINAKRKEKLDKGSYFEQYVEYCKYDMSYDKPYEINLITSDDIFDHLLNIRHINSGVNRNKEKLSSEYLNYKFKKNDVSFEDYDEFISKYDTKSKSLSRFVRERLGNNNIIEQSNGETSLLFWEREIKENGIYILDEPENSLSASNQIKLKKFIEDSTRFYNCQFIISTHSPFLLNLDNARIYDLDEIPVKVKKWTELENVRTYYKFFKERENEFED